MKRKKLLRKLDSLKEMIERHKIKIDEENRKSFPYGGCIRHWEVEITVFEEQIKKIREKLER